MEARKGVRRRWWHVRVVVKRREEGVNMVVAAGLGRMVVEEGGLGWGLVGGGGGGCCGSFEGLGQILWSSERGLLCVMRTS